eukprot:2548878-Amphidinium_carterae.1
MKSAHSRTILSWQHCNPSGTSREREFRNSVVASCDDGWTIGRIQLGCKLVLEARTNALSIGKAFLVDASKAGLEIPQEISLTQSVV